LLAERQRSLDERYGREIEQLRSQIAETRRAPAPPPSVADREPAPPPVAPSAAQPAPAAPQPAPASTVASVPEEPVSPPPPAPAPAPAATVAETRPAPSAGVPPSTALPAPLVPPKLVRYHPPAYPALARRRGVQGTVVLSVRVSARGEVTEVRFVRRVGEDVGIDEAAEAAARRARFSPATRGGTPVEAWYTLTIPFQM
jgi:protein TonB